MRITSWLLCVGLVLSAPANGNLDCSNIESDDARLQCYDSVAGRVTADESQAHPPNSDEDDQAPVATSVEQFGKAPEKVTEIIAESAGIETVDEIRASVERVNKDLHGRLVFALDNKQKWRQVRSESMYIKAGDEVRIRRAALGSFTLQLQSGGRKTKVRRVD